MAFDANRYTDWKEEVRAAIDAYVATLWPKSNDGGPQTAANTKSVTTAAREAAYTALLATLLAEPEPAP